MLDFLSPPLLLSFRAWISLPVQYLCDSSGDPSEEVLICLSTEGISVWSSFSWRNLVTLGLLGGDPCRESPVVGIPVVGIPVVGHFGG